MNRRERRVEAKKRRSQAGMLKLRCIGCDRVGQPMTKEHIWPKWMIKRTNARAEPIRWMTDKRIDPMSATIPLCLNCNHDFGEQLEGPVSQIFETLEAGNGISDSEAELLVRWLWKFEGLFWNATNFSKPHAQYSNRWTLRERVLGPSLTGMRDGLMLAVSLVKNNDDGHDAWPMGIDSEIGTFNGIFVSGVFCRTALMVLLEQFADLVPSEYGKYQLLREQDLSGTKVFFPPTNFEYGKDAIKRTSEASDALARAHEDMAFEQLQRPHIIRKSPRVELP